MELAINPIELRIATADEKATAKSMIEPPKNPGSYSPSMGRPKYVLVSEIAFPGYLSFYSAYENNAGELESTGWIGKC